MKPPKLLRAQTGASLRGAQRRGNPGDPEGWIASPPARNDQWGCAAQPTDPIPPAPVRQAPGAFTDPDVGDLRFRALLGAEQWSSLAPAIRARFSKRLADGRTAVYAGVITETLMSRSGWLLAQAARLFGGPLPLSREAGVPATVTVSEDPASGGQFWTRIYGRQRGFPQVIHSAKRFRGPTGLEEYLGSGLGMALAVHGAGDALHFTSDHYFVELFGRHLRLPRFLSPGDTTVSHLDHGGGRFTFVLEVRHPRLGLLVRQTGLFHDVAQVGADR